MTEDLHIQLEKYGFAIFDVLNANDIAYLNQLCEKYLSVGDSDFISSSHILNKNDSDFINAELHKILHSNFKLLFPELQLLGGTLATKTKGKSNLEAHQDWSIVDEAKFNSYNLWIPLVDTNIENGTLGLIPGSQKWNSNVRGFNIPNPYRKFTSQFLEIGHEPELKAGQAILYNHKLIHYSRPNMTDKHRNVAIIGVKDKMADLRVSLSSDNKNIKTFSVTEKDFYRFDIEKIQNNNPLIVSGKLDFIDMNWKKIRTNFTENLSEEFKYLIPQRKGFLSKLLYKFYFRK